MTACSNGNQALITSSRLDKVTFGTNWIVQAKYGGFDQAIATGTYKDHGLDITIKMGEPQVSSGTQLLMWGAVDFFMSYGIDALKAIAQEISQIPVAAIS